MLCHWTKRKLANWIHDIFLGVPVCWIGPEQRYSYLWLIAKCAVEYAAIQITCFDVHYAMYLSKRGRRKHTHQFNAERILNESNNRRDEYMRHHCCDVHLNVLVLCLIPSWFRSKLKRQPLRSKIVCVVFDFNSKVNVASEVNIDLRPKDSVGVWFDLEIQCYLSMVWQMVLTNSSHFATWLCPRGLEISSLIFLRASKTKYRQGSLEGCKNRLDQLPTAGPPPFLRNPP